MKNIAILSLLLQEPKIKPNHINQYTTKTQKQTHLKSNLIFSHGLLEKYPFFVEKAGTKLGIHFVIIRSLMTTPRQLIVHIKFRYLH